MSTKAKTLSLLVADVLLGGEPLRGIKEQPAWTESPRILLLCDGTGVRVAEIRIPDRNLTPRVVELLGFILEEIESQQQGGGPIRLEQ